MSDALNANALAQLFTEARTFNKFSDEPLSDATIYALHDLLKWAPTSMNSQPGRFVFVRSPEGKARLRPALAPSNAEKTMRAPVCVIIAHDTQFHEYITEQFPAYDGKPMFDANPALTQATALRGSTMQGAYLILAARSLGLSCGPMGGFNNEQLDQEFFPDGRFRSNFLVNLGYGDASGNYPRGPRLSFDRACQII
jgi:3-hydroxypropanoate dehydrogenase